MATREENYGGKSIVVDSVTELFGSQTKVSEVVRTVSGVLTSQRASKDLDKLREELSKVTSDGIITVTEQLGLRREFSSLQSAFATIVDAFERDSTLVTSPYYIALNRFFYELDDYLKEVFEKDENYKDRDYYVKDTDPDVTGLFSDCWSFIQQCNVILNSQVSLQSKYTLEAEGPREIVDRITINARVIYYDEGLASDVTTKLTDSDFTWKRISDDEWEKTGPEMYIRIA